MSKEPELKDGVVGREIVAWFIKHESDTPIAAKLKSADFTNNIYTYELFFEDREPGIFEFKLNPVGIFNIESETEVI